MSATDPTRVADGDASTVSLCDLLLDQLRDVYSVEQQLIPAFAELESLATAPALRKHLRGEIARGREQAQRLERIGRSHGWDLGGDPSKAMKGLIEGGHAHVAEVEFLPARDFLIIAHSHRVKHYEMAAYAVTVTLAERIGLEDARASLQASLDEERASDEAFDSLTADAVMSGIPKA